MPKKKEVKKVKIVKKIADEIEVVEVSSKDIAVVEWLGRSRTYSKELHGGDFKKLAEQFAGKVQGIVK